MRVEGITDLDLEPRQNNMKHEMTHQEAAEAVGVTYMTISRWIRAGTLTPVRTVGREQFFDRTAVERLIAARAVTRPQASRERESALKSKKSTAYWDKIRSGEIPLSSRKPKTRRQPSQ